jgi:hypothetical protein
MRFKAQTALHILADTGMGEESVGGRLPADRLAWPSAVLACAKPEDPHVAPHQITADSTDATGFPAATRHCQLGIYA